MKKTFISFLVLLLLLSGCKSNIKIEYFGYVNDIYTGSIFSNYYFTNYERHRSFLSIKDQLTYQWLYQAIITYKPIKSFDYQINADKIAAIRDSILLDHPEIFWLGDLSFNQNKSSTDIYLKYTYSQEEIIKFQNKITSKINSIIKETKNYKSDYLKAKYLYDYLIHNLKYVQDSPNNQNILSTFINYKTVCAGYAKGFQYLANLVGLKSSVLIGKVNYNHQMHIWNTVEIDSESYYLDATWGDFENNKYSFPIYGSFLFNNTVLKKAYSNYKHPLEKIGDKYNYYKLEGLFFNNLDLPAIANKIIEAKRLSKNNIQIQFPLDKYNDYINKLEKNGLINKLLTITNIKSFNYYSYKETGCLMILI